ncbi:HXXEE domain-containing protein [Streptomyces roseoverticillatus]|uniref:HXXEE domain-containing protein n=1 Tax=Streptomyces roseoverticillatus TaxID=66429 RepID=UPI001F3F3975|nr:HXXEE domain-containing protein [Streptomyces roseoverticillatus]MCF3102221.1 HXXEE domain-containing protein [Streptomyces roseoverticillatus]
MTRAPRRKTSDPTAAGGAGGVPAAVSWGLFAAWAANDIEEILTMAPWSRAAVPRLRARFPRVPDRVWSRMEVTQPHVNTAIGLMALLMAAAAADGARTRGRSAFFRTALTGFGLHGLVHMAQAAAYRGYTPGVATSPTIVIPYSIWALTHLRRAGLQPASPVLCLALFPVATGAVHTLARRLTKSGVVMG